MIDTFYIYMYINLIFIYRKRGWQKDTTGAADGCADNLLRDFNICNWQPVDVIDSYLICIFQNVC